MESLQIIVGVETSSAIEALRAIVTELDSVKAAADRADQAIGNLEGGLREVGSTSAKAGEQVEGAKGAVESLSEAAADARRDVGALGTSAQQAAPQVGQLATQTQTAAGTTAQYTQNVVNATTQVNQFATQTNVQINTINSSSTALGSTTNNLATQVHTWLAAYVGMQALIGLFDKLAEKMRDTVEAQKELADLRLTHDQRLEMLMGNLGLKGEAGQTRARNLRDDLLKRAPVSDEKAIEALSIANSTGHDPRDSEGMEFATQLAYLAQREQLNKETVTQIVRSLKGRGLDSVAGLKEAIAKADAQFEVSASTDRQAFWRGYVSGVLPALPKGVDPDYASSIYSGFLNTKIGEEAAGQATAQAFAFAQGTNKQSLRYFAHQASQLGVTSPGGVSDDDARRFLDADSSGQAQSYRRDQDRLRKLEEEEKLAYVTGRHTGKRPMSKREVTTEVAALHDFDPERAVQELGQTNARAAEQLSGMIAQARQMNDASRGLLEKTKEQLTQKQEAAAYLKVGLEDRMSRVVLPTIAGLQTDEDVNRFNAEVGGQFRRLDNVEMLGAASTQAQVRKAQAAAQAAQARDTDEQNKAYNELDTARDQATKNQVVMSQDAAVDSGYLYNQRVLQQAKERRSEKMMNGEYLGDPDDSIIKSLDNLTLSKDTYLVDEAVAVMNADLARLKQQLSQIKDPTAARTFAATIAGIEGKLNTSTTGIQGRVLRHDPAIYAKAIADYGREIGNEQSTLEKWQKAHAGQAPRGVDPSTQAIVDQEVQEASAAFFAESINPARTPESVSAAADRLNQAKATQRAMHAAQGAPASHSSTQPADGGHADASGAIALPEGFASAGAFDVGDPVAMALAADQARRRAGSAHQQLLQFPSAAAGAGAGHPLAAATTREQLLQLQASQAEAMHAWESAMHGGHRKTIAAAAQRYHDSAAAVSSAIHRLPAPAPHVPTGLIYQREADGQMHAVKPHPEASHAQEDGGGQVIHHHHYNQTYHTQHVGNLWAGSDDPMDLPGPLQEFG